MYFCNPNLKNENIPSGIQNKGKMSRVCQITGKKAITGNNVSHSNIKTKRKFRPNLHTKKFFVPELDEYVVLKVSAKGMRNINKKGIWNCIVEASEKGILK